MNDTIVSLATNLGVAAISIIRISGQDSIKIVNDLFQGKDLEKVKSHTLNYGHIVLDGEIIDEVLVSVMREPKTYTGEDTVEINCHGGIGVTNKILEILLTKGCRLASRGEFTKRRFLNGHIDLMQAEAILDLINSETEKERKIAIQGLNGNSSKMIKDLREILINLISNIEVNIDYPEYEDIYEVTKEDIRKNIDVIHEKIEKIIAESENGKLIKNGIKTAIIGRPNVGKSSLLNRLLGSEKAIVTDIPGTTRDIVEGNILIDGIKLNIIDTAGIRETKDIVEKIGVNKSRRLMEEADLVLLLLNNNEELTEADKELILKTKDKNTIIVINKNDLEEKIDVSSLNLENIVYINTLTYKGIEALKNKIISMFNLGKISQNEFNYITNERQLGKLKECLDLSLDVKNNLDTLPLDILEVDLKTIWNTLGTILGVTYDNELLDNLFSKFCVGK